MLLFLNVLFPVIMGAILPLFRMKSRTLRSVYVMLVTCITSVLAFYNVFSSPSDTAFVFLHLTEKAVCMLQLDDMGRLLRLKEKKLSDGKDLIKKFCRWLCCTALSTWSTKEGKTAFSPGTP